MAMTDGLGRGRRDRGGRGSADVRDVHRDRPAGRDASRTSACTAQSVELHLQDLWIKDIAITTGLVSANDDADAAQARRPGQARRRRSSPPTASRLDQIIDAYDTFGRAAETKALKVVITSLTSDSRHESMGPTPGPKIGPNP